ncbi:hypothetical protein ANCCAN_14341 [Ancylostoma caninum]|uniref:Endonuclease/exonuclease/phosphatase domain-containing protein n=1 Tax=Ancylostoma caninum TaxID=29170 RepID=A0A368G5U2_ANCCA|nr:hypothetical protein ANCCAN_14341 [Ancylostoma caninum]
MGIAETRICGSGRMDFQSGYSLYYSGNLGRTCCGVSFYVHSTLTRRCRCFFHSDRIIELTVTLKVRQTLRVIQVHAPLSSHSDDEYSSFLEELTRIIDARRNRQLVVLGDFNATPGVGNQYEQYIGIHAAESRNARGSMLAQFCEERRLYLANSFFQKRMQTRWTWRCDALSLKKEIDYILVRNINDVKDVGVLSSVNAGSDHRLLRCILKKQQTKRFAQPYQGSRTVDKLLLRHYVEQQLTAASFSGNVNEDYKIITSIINKATDMATSYKPLPPRISQRTKQLFILRKELRYGKNSAEKAVEYAEVCKLVRKSLKQDL